MMDDQEKKTGERLDSSFFKFFWEVSPIISRKKTIHDFLKKIDIFKSLTDYEIMVFAKYLHKRSFQPNELIVKEGKVGHSFNIILNGKVKVFVKKHSEDSDIKLSEDNHTLIYTLEKYHYFGELALLEDRSKRKGSAFCNTSVTLLSLYRSDFEEIIDQYPKIGAKIMRALSSIVVQRLNLATTKIQELKSSHHEIQS